MNTRKKSSPKCWIFMSPTEYEQVLRDKSNTTCRSISEYGRKKMLDKPITVYYRNKSYDDFTEAYTSFKRDLDIILENGAITEQEKNWLFGEIKTIKHTITKLYDHVCENKTDKKPL